MSRPTGLLKICLLLLSTYAMLGGGSFMPQALPSPKYSLVLRGGGGDKMRLAVRKVKGPAASARKNRPEKRSRLNEGVVARANRKISKMIHGRAVQGANMRLEAGGERVGMKLATCTSAADRRLNIPSPSPGHGYLQRLKSMSGGRRHVKGGSLGKAKRR